MLGSCVGVVPAVGFVAQGGWVPGAALLGTEHVS